MGGPSLLGNNTSTIGHGRRIKASLSNPGSPNNGRNSKPGTPIPDAKSQEDQVDRAIMLEEVKRLLEDQEEEEFANLETFADYMPAKCKSSSFLHFLMKGSSFDLYNFNLFVVYFDFLQCNLANATLT